MFKVKVMDRISEALLREFPKSLYEVGEEISDPDVILVRSRNLHKEIISSSVRAVGRAGIGVDNIPVESLSKMGVPVFFTPGANANAVKELVLASLLMLGRNLGQAIHYIKTLEGETLSDHDIHLRVEKEKKQFVGSELISKTMGVIGLGNIGVKIANMAHHLGMKVIGYDPVMSEQNMLALLPDVRKTDDLTFLLQNSNYITLHLPLLEETKNFISHKRLLDIPKGSYLLNFSRAELVNDEALLNYLESDHLAGYATDFPTKMLMKNQKVISFPHLGASTKEAEENCARAIIHSIREFLEKGVITQSKNFPETKVTTLLKHRLCITTINRPGVLAQITEIISQAKINISSITNNSRDEIAYNIIDLDAKLKDETVKSLEQIEEVLKVIKISP